MSLRISIVCPAPPKSRQGNRITALRWARILRSAGHRVHVATSLDEDADLLVALHARRSAHAVRRYRARHPDRPLVVALTGTDLYHDLERSRAARQSIETADRLVVLQADAVSALPAHARAKARVIHQSALGRRSSRRPSGRTFDVCVLSHLRSVKDPFRAAMGARLLPAESRVRVVHAGRALTKQMARRARHEMSRNPRYRWLGDVSHPRAMALLSRSRLLVLSSRLEGGANVIGEAAIRGVPVLASRMSGNVGLLGRRYPGLFPTGDTEALAGLMRRVETDRDFHARLRREIGKIAPLFRPSRERRAWRDLINEIS